MMALPGLSPQDTETGNEKAVVLTSDYFVLSQDLIYRSNCRYYSLNKLF
ncbi:unnamed protein product [Echinostoma caproni]|uniref:Uncharacterized protein n=1 Tax=Echinostoma caproni TaxID=27848 RepID=A0A3P8HWI6_9TREM|nr:unnamed protein product [Echinostoma caproni]